MEYIRIIDISKDEFNQRFNQRVVQRKTMDIIAHWEKSIYIGTIHHNSFYFYRKPAYHHNDFVTIMKGNILETEDGNFVNFKYDKFLSTKIISTVCSILFLCLGLLSFLLGHPFGLIFSMIGMISYILIMRKSQKSKKDLLNELKIIAKIEED